MTSFDAQLLDLYSERMKALIAHIPTSRPLPTAEATVHRRSPLCGSAVTLSVILDDTHHLQHIGHELDACALATATTAIVLNAAPGSTLAEIQSIRDIIATMLKSELTPGYVNGVPLPSGKWADIEILQPAALVRSRHRSVLLPFDTLLAAMSEALQHRTASEKP